jgi:hypothetical protein
MKMSRAQNHAMWTILLSKTKLVTIFPHDKIQLLILGHFYV